MTGAMATLTKTGTLTRDFHSFEKNEAFPGLLIAFSPENSSTVDRCRVTSPFVVGRGPKCSLTVLDDKMSKQHFRIIRCVDGDYFIEDLKSTNGTFLNGKQLDSRKPILDASVIRAGQSVFIFIEVAGPVFEFSMTENFGFIGGFHAAPMIQELKEAVLSKRHLLLTGPSGAGKELTARAVATLVGKEQGPRKMVSHNAARFSSEEEAAATLFGVGARVFSNVDSRPGLIEEAMGGLLFIDEVHNFPERLQRSLLRVIEDGQSARIGETRLRNADVLFVFAANVPGPTYGLAPDLLARLRVVQVPSLSKRVADIPEIFNHVLTSALAKQRINPVLVLPLLRGDHYETLCLDGFPADNVRGLIDLADRISTKIAAGVETNRAITKVFTERFDTTPVITRPSTSKKPITRQVTEDVEESLKTEWDSRYEAHKDLIIATFHECGGNISALERFLRARGMRCSRRWLTVFLDKWGVR